MNKIYYFTGSGNSLSIAKKVSEKLGNCELNHVTSKLVFSTPIEADILGFVFPVYAWGIPALFQKFIKKVKVEKVNYVFAITDYAGSCGNALGLFDKLLQKKNIKVDALCEVIMPGNYLVMGNASSKESAEKILKKADSKIDEIASNIQQRKQISKKKVSFVGKLQTAIIHPLFAYNIQKSDKSFFYIEACNGCGICVKVCPAENIVLNDQKHPIWQHRCEQCHACIHWCPQRAIEFNKKTANKNRYTHPEIKVSEMI